MSVENNPKYNKNDNSVSQEQNELNGIEFDDKDYEEYKKKRLEDRKFLITLCIIIAVMLLYYFI